MKIGVGIAATVAVTAATGGALAPLVAAEIGAVGAVGAAVGAAAGAGAGGVLTGIGAAGRRLYSKLAKRKPGSEETQQEDQEFDVISDQSVANLPDTRSLASTFEDQEVEDAETITLIQKHK